MPETSSPITIDRSTILLRIVVALQVAWIAFVGAMARGVIPEAFSLLTPAVPVMLLGCPALVLCLANNLSRSKFVGLLAVELALFALQLLALLPAVQ